MESTGIDLQDPVFTNNEQFKLIACCSCGMFQYFSIRYLNLNYNLNTDASGAFKYTCLNCHEKFSLLRQVDELNVLNRKLHDRISSLVHLREAENSFDQTLDSLGFLTNQFANISINTSSIPQPDNRPLSQTSVIDASNIPCIDETQIVYNSTTNSNVSRQSHNTSVWSGLDCSESSNTLATEVLPYNGSSLPSISDIRSSSSVLHVETMPDDEDGSSLSNTFTPIPDLLNSTKSVNNQKNRYSDDSVEILFMGDKNIANVNLLAFVQREKYYKVTHPNARVKNTENTVNYLLKKRHKNVKTVIAHTGTNDVMKKCPSECMKADFISLAKTISEFGKKLIISGPVPLPCMNSEQFSRLLSLNIWLNKWTGEEGILFIDNFDLFWKKNFLFHRDRRTLDKLGSTVLTNSMTSNLSTLINLIDL